MQILALLDSDKKIEVLKQYLMFQELEIKTEAIHPDDAAEEIFEHLAQVFDLDIEYTNEQKESLGKIVANGKWKSGFVVAIERKKNPESKEKKFMKIVLNPKSNDDYFKMFDKLFKISSSFSDLVIHCDRGLQTFISNQITIRGLHFNRSDLQRDTIREIINTSLQLERNDRIESWLKYIRATKSNQLLNTLHEIVHLKALSDFPSNEIYEQYLAFLNKIIPFKKVLEKIVEEYLSAHPNSTLRQHDNDEYDIDEFIHFVHLYNTDKQRFRAIHDYSWSGKSLSEIRRTLREIESEILDNTVDIKKYTEKFLNAEETEEYLKINKKLTWYIIYANACEFEALIGKSCGYDQYATHLFSLRSITEDNRFNSHITLSAKEFKYPEILDKLEIDGLFEVHQVKGKNNSMPKEEYHEAIIKLFASLEFGWQVPSEYKPDSDFTIDELVDEKLKNKFLQIKPNWQSKAKSFAQYGLLDAEIKKYFSNQRKFESSELIIEKNDIFLVFKDFDSLLKSLEKFDHGNTVRGHRTNIDDFNSIDFSIDKETKKEYLDYIKKTYPDQVEKFFEDHDEDEIHQLLDRAYTYGYESGTSSSKYEAYQDFYKDLELNDDDHGHQIGRVDYDTKEKVWIISVYMNSIIEHYDDYGQVGIYTCDRNTFSGGRRGIEWDFDYDSEVAYEEIDSWFK
jgi:hypothetical protein